MTDWTVSPWPLGRCHCCQKPEPINSKHAWTALQPEKHSARVRPPGEAPAGFWRDHQSSKVNSIRTRTLIEKADMIVVRFGDQYKQWNAAFDAGYCAALDKPDRNKPARRLRSQMLVLAFRRARQPCRPSSQFPALARARCRYAFGNRRLLSWY